jgi:hypothetical protein
VYSSDANMQVLPSTVIQTGPQACQVANVCACLPFFSFHLRCSPHIDKDCLPGRWHSPGYSGHSPRNASAFEALANNRTLFEKVRKCVSLNLILGSRHTWVAGSGGRTADVYREGEDLQQAPQLGTVCFQHCCIGLFPMIA